LARLVVFGDAADPRKWVQCANEIAKRIADGQYPSGEWLPPVVTFSAELDANIGTVQQALIKLDEQRLISRAKNVGYYVGCGTPPDWQKPNKNNVLPTRSIP
jgi:DNA-binding GntR family transcriptional regulator